ncbi:MAG: ATP-grasp domain-containing protein [Candidatus Daviesbacteria bacterium]|nr:ATP-grasp domain-containing protein [Candidatus Daviesbacteria bacterium]
MKKIKIAVTGAGGGVGQSIIKGLYDTEYTIVGLDADILATGLYGVPIAYKTLSVEDPGYIENILEICKKEDCKLLFPGLDSELALLSEHSERFKEIGTTVVVSSLEAVEVADNKLLTYKLLSSHKIPVARTFALSDFLSSEGALNFPVIIKPMVGGSRSKDVYFLQTKKDLDWIISKPNFDKGNFVIQEYIEGEEYTCGTISLDQKCWGVIVMRRILRNGDTYKCFTVKNKKIEEVVMKVINTLKPFGACNVQLRLKAGVLPIVFEINARCSGTTGPRALAGFNEPKMIADYLLFNKKPVFKIKEVSMLRYWKEVVVKNHDVGIVNSKKKIINKRYPKL